jgi:hypothetical protein
MAASGELQFVPCHERSAVGPMAGVVSASMPMWIVENEAHGNRAYCTFNEGLGRVLRYGAYDDEVIDRLVWMRDVLARVMRSALQALDAPIDLRAMIAQALQMGDEGHNRNRAGTSLLLRELLPALVTIDQPAKDVSEVARFIAGNDHFFLNLSMPAAKATADAAAGVEGSSIVVTMARNGTEFGVRLSGTGDRWFTGPAIVRFVGGSAQDALDATRQMYGITWAESESYQVPALGFRGTPLGIDCREVVHTGILPFVNTGIAHKDPGIGQVGAGLVEPPMEAFSQATVALAELA